jgi:hypothetical protein
VYDVLLTVVKFSVKPHRSSTENGFVFLFEKEFASQSRDPAQLFRVSHVTAWMMMMRDEGRNESSAAARFERCFQTRHANRVHAITTKATCESQPEHFRISILNPLESTSSRFFRTTVLQP